MTTDGHEALYNERILALAGGLNKDDRLDAPDATAQEDSPLCGSRIRVDVRLDQADRLAGYGHQVHACALGQSSAAILQAGAIGRSVEELEAARDALEAMLKRGGPPPGAPWSDLEVLQPAKDFKSRHASILLPFRAVVKAMRSALDARAPADG
jgi:NifU-like protein involved in Fe-S cluster formation